MMDGKLEQRLFNKYPKIFQQRKLPMSETCMCWGIDTPDSWYTLLDALCSGIQERVDSGKCGQVEATQVKEKFGGLRFYHNGCDEAVYALIEMAYLLSISTCAECGMVSEDVSCSSSGWVTYLCPECKALVVKKG